ncbi:Mlp family lipoprotein (plasmid) [Borreliella burgdorferi]|uniref:Lipoprotein MlpG n=1 Tax=Borreliella burgdorferi (strain ATCC 35210 / DSM 4680 / CIP 102532 / B31) TaxID=224326 RepID=MLPG_BORBU|nr:Mlp family lipoprotein [Borreliella burgdorferi]Q9S083.1 RecName: Full=Lipoprotein MlpG; Flags: Precursor [Borreliella burgdorferi B31]AAF07597.1 lipoprotein [Borreliella burgdorferi B31]MCD2412533.1 Mlp family lipoprotein [Borreliella burgdorferi]MCR8876585.1 Mlp family lipoprotein [Borreliella burgdorferi]UUX87929.1 Mlp family lipoprotein [Borreliella burgdorferi]
MKIINILFCLFLLMLNGCNSNDTNTKQTKSRQKRDLTQKEATQEKPKSKSKEDLLREKLSDDQKTQLDWLKTALTGVGKFDKFLENDEGKIKSALEHIKTELDKCNGNDEGKNTFKTTVQGFFSGGNIDNFADQATATCN